MSKSALLVLVLAVPFAAMAQPAGPEVNCTITLNPDAPAPDDRVEARFAFTLSEGWHVNSNKPLGEYAIATALNFDASEAFQVTEIRYPEHKIFTFAFSPDEVAVFGEEFEITAVLTMGGALPAEITGHLYYQACNDQICAPPAKYPFRIALGETGAAPAPDETETPAETTRESPGAPGDWADLAERFVVAGKGGYASTEGFLDFIARAESGDAAPNEGFVGKQWWLVLLLVVGGGLLLNLTPCVLPLIPINIAIIGAGARAGSRARGFALGGVYGVGIALVYGLLGLVVVLGVSTAFGTINATVWFNAVIAALFVVLGLAMFDLIQIDFSRFQAKFGIRKNERGSFLIALVMGCISALLAGACVAPAVIYTIVYAQDLYSQGTTVALLLPFLLGVGMALPWPFAGAGLSFLPKPGAWMVRVKQAFGVFILLFAAYYGHQAYTLSGFHRAEVVAAEGWETDLGKGLQQALDQDKPVFLDVWATWCKNCIVMDKTVLKEPAVLDALADYVKIKYQAEDPSSSPAKDVFQRYNLPGLPAYIILQPKQ